jgi:hypothetical protein
MAMVAGWRVLRAAVLGCARVLGEGVVWLGMVHAHAMERALPIAAGDGQANAGTDAGPGVTGTDQKSTPGVAGLTTGSALPAAGHPERIPAPVPGTAAEMWLYEQLRALDSGPEQGRAR